MTGQNHNLLDQARYHWNVTLLGQGFLRFDRLRTEMRMRNPSFWKNDKIAPPLFTSGRLKELISRHYLKGRHANLTHKVAWVTSGAPAEFLLALGYYILYPENHAAVCGIRRVSEEYCVHAEEAGFPRDICSYARTDIGAAFTGKTPVGNLPRPDLLLCCTNICQTVLYWYRVLAHHFKVPLIIVDTPFIYDEATPHSIAYVQKQLENGVETAERVAGKSLVYNTLVQVTKRSQEATNLWMKILEMGKQRPAPITAFDEFIHMAPIVEMRGEAFTVDYYRTMAEELAKRVSQGVGAVVHEKKRLIWDNLPIWYRLRWMSELLARHDVSLVASTYTNAWGELAHMIDPGNPIESAARVYTHPILNRGVGHKLETINKMVADYDADGVILHSDRSCKPYSVGQMDQRDLITKKAGVPALLLESDHNDPRAFSEEQVENRLSAFVEVLYG